MKRIFEQGEFNRYVSAGIEQSRKPIYESASFDRKTTVFISHKHDDLSDLKNIISFLESKYNVLAYIDSRDSSLPKITSRETAEKIKERIKKCDKFILLATNGAIDSKWCNWELGFGDAQKYKNHIALFPMKPKDEYDHNYKGNEYMAIYPYIAYYDGSEKYRNGESIKQGYYIVTESDDTKTIEPLEKWLKNR